MNCPRCDAALKKEMREDVTIDVCPKCAGVWLDRGELDHIATAMRDAQRSREDLVDFAFGMLELFTHRW
ncbi:MAG: hypothetical protein GC159_19415 [Phycisphaera sp.]|nr:hypothetical protein [Phycisphaera sp.]